MLITLKPHNYILISLACMWLMLFNIWSSAHVGNTSKALFSVIFKLVYNSLKIQWWKNCQWLVITSQIYISYQPNWAGDMRPSFMACCVENSIKIITGQILFLYFHFWNTRKTSRTFQAKVFDQEVRDTEQKNMWALKWSIQNDDF